MQNYELLFVLPGTLSEDELKPVVEKVVEVAKNNGASEVELHEMGKSRLAYPMKHIRYGYFFLMYFQSEPTSCPVIKDKLRLVTEILRTVLTKYNPDSPREKKIVMSAPVQTKTQEGEEEPAQLSPEVKVKKSTPVEKEKEKKEESPKETKAENIEIGDIDKKLDELLDTSIADM